MKQRWQDPVARLEMLNAQNKGKQSDDWKNKRRDIANRMWRNGEFKDQARKLSEYWTGKPKSEETEVPFDLDRQLNLSEIQMTVKYCIHDVEETIEVFRTFYKKGMNLLLEEMKDGNQSRN